MINNYIWWQNDSVLKSSYITFQYCTVINIGIVIVYTWFHGINGTNGLENCGTWLSVEPRCREHVKATELMGCNNILLLPCGYENSDCSRREELTAIYQLTRNYKRIDSLLCLTVNMYIYLSYNRINQDRCIVCLILLYHWSAIQKHRKALEHLNNFERIKIVYTPPTPNLLE